MSRYPKRPALSTPLVALAASSLIAGIVSGGITYLNRSAEQEQHVGGTAAWGPHAVVLLVAMGLVVIARLRGYPPSIVLAPVGKTAALRVRRTVGEARSHPTAALRLLVAVVPAIVLVYGPYRTGIQILAGFDHNFVVDAWGGPTYLGAMACHYLDGALLMTVAAWLIGRLLLPVPEPAYAVSDWPNG